ncbi:MAG: hypothetical protein WCD49_07050 [Candidatus Acidiferrales bacterium]
MFRPDKFEKLLILIFVLTLPLINPWVRGDGVGYYAYARALLIEHRLDFRKDWLAANTSYRMGRVDATGNILPAEYTSTGHLNNHFSIGPAILWFPFLLMANAFVHVSRAFGSQIPANGFSFPYILAMALATAFYGFLALWISFQLAKKYVPGKWAFLGTLGIWFASSLPVYMYFNPSWSHAHSAFAAALFFWYWDRTRGERTWRQWVILGAISGLMMDVYYVNAVLLVIPLLESIVRYWGKFKSHQTAAIRTLFLQNVLFTLIIFAAFLPTLISKRIIYGSYVNFGYSESWNFRSPALLKVCFSSEHGLFSWTPIIGFAVVGLFLLRRQDKMLSLCAVTAFATYLYAIGCYSDWAGISSFGSRFFVSLTPFFILGLAALFDWMAHAWTERSAIVVATSATALLLSWNLGLIFQWGVHLIPARGPISWRDAAYNQVAIVPKQTVRTLETYLTRRGLLMNHIEQQDLKQLKEQNKNPSNQPPKENSE